MADGARHLELCNLVRTSGTDVDDKYGLFVLARLTNQAKTRVHSQRRPRYQKCVRALIMCKCRVYSHARDTFTKKNHVGFDDAQASPTTGHAKLVQRAPSCFALDEIHVTIRSQLGYFGQKAGIDGYQAGLQVVAMLERTTIQTHHFLQRPMQLHSRLGTSAQMQAIDILRNDSRHDTSKFELARPQVRPVGLSRAEPWP